MTHIDSYVIDKVKAMRIEKGMTQATLAVKMGVSDSFIGDVESPRTRAKYNIGHLNKLAVIFGCSPREFLPERPV